MSWNRLKTNYTINRLSKSAQEIFGMIRRDPSERKAQIQCYVDGKSEWLDLLDYRYGMSDEERLNDEQQSGIPDTEWAKSIDVAICDMVHEHNMEKSKQKV